MDKKNVIIGVSWLCFAALAIEYKRLCHDFKLADTTLRENEKAFALAKKITTEVLFEDIVENFEE